MLNYTTDRRMAYKYARKEAIKRGVMLQTFEPFAIRNLADENKLEFSDVVCFLDFHLCQHQSKIQMLKRLASEGKQVYIHTNDVSEIETNTGANRIKTKCDSCGKTISEDSNLCINCKGK